MALGAPSGVEQYARGSGTIVRHHRVIDEVDLHRIVERDSSSIPTRDVIRENVVGDLISYHARRSARVALHVRSVDVLQLETAAAAFLGGVALEQVGVDHEAGTAAIAKPWRAISVVRGAAFGRDAADIEEAVRALAFDDQPAAIGGQRRIDALIEDDRVVLDVAIPVEPELATPPPLPLLRLPHTQL